MAEKLVLLLILLGIINAHFLLSVLLFVVRRKSTVIQQRIPNLTLFLALLFGINGNISIIIIIYPQSPSFVAWYLYLLPIPTLLLLLWRATTIGCRAEIRRNVAFLNHLDKVSLTPKLRWMVKPLSLLTLSPSISEVVLKLSKMKPEDAHQVGKRDLEKFQDYTLSKYIVIKGWICAWLVMGSFLGILYGLQLVDVQRSSIPPDSSNHTLAVPTLYLLPECVFIPICLAVIVIQFSHIFSLKLLKRDPEYYVILKEHQLSQLVFIIMMVAFLVIYFNSPQTCSITSNTSLDGYNNTLVTGIPINCEDINAFFYIPVASFWVLAFTIHVSIPAVLVFFTTYQRQILRVKREFSIDALDMVLNNPALYKDFKQMAQNQLCTENIMFYEQYKAMHDHLGELRGKGKQEDPQLYKELMALYETFVSPNGAYALNLANDMRQLISDTIVNQKKCDPNVFEPVWKNVRYLLYSNTLPKFLEANATIRPQKG